MAYQDIEKKAEETRVAVSSVIPVPVVEIAKSLDISIFDIEMTEIQGLKPSGVLTLVEEERWSILLNTDDAFTRKRFTIAHEIGHFVLHHGSGYVDHFSAGETFYRSGEDTREEREANFFAACLLMPSQQMIDLWPTFESPAAIAEHFKVSEVSMTFRLKYLKLVE